MPRKKKWPRVLKRDSATVKIRRYVNKGYGSLTVEHGIGKGRERLARNSYQDAKDLTDQKLVELASGLAPEKQLNSTAKPSGRVWICCQASGSLRAPRARETRASATRAR